MDSSVTRRGFVRAMGIGAGAMTGMATVQARAAESARISQDEFGVATVKNLGRRVAEVAMSRAYVAE